MDLPTRPKSSKGRSGSARSPGNLQPRARSQPSLRPAAAAPPPPPPPLNRYKVLPSIEARRPEAPEDSPEDAQEDTDKGDVLLLAVRAPCGRRFEQRFAAAAPLRALREDAEARYGAAYGEVTIQAAGAPRRSFTDLERSLEECGIRDRSLLCISLRGGDAR